MIKNEKRNRDIGKLLAAKKLSYSVIATMTGTTRDVVSGVAFRRRHPGKNRTGVGTGRQPHSYEPKKTIHAAL